MTNLGIGLGMMGGVAKSVGNIMNETLPTSQPAPKTDDGLENFKIKLEKLKLMKDSGILSEEEFAAEKNVLLKNL